MPTRYIWKKGKRYYYYDTYRLKDNAHKIAKYYRKKNKSKYFIIEYEHGWFSPEKRYQLYLNKVIALC